MLKLLAFDYGASSGRAILGTYDGDKLSIEEIHRFSNDPVLLPSGFHWDILRLFHEMKQGVLKCVKTGRHELSGIGVDTWGVDFGLLDKSGNLLGNPFHYRNAGNDGMIEEACKTVPKREIYGQTGIQFMKFNSLYQLLALKRSNPAILERSASLLFIPDLFNYLLSGVKTAEFTIASTSQMYNPIKGAWAGEMLQKLGIPENVLSPVTNPCNVIGSLGSWITEELGVPSIPVISVAGHDTGSAVASVPAATDRYAYLSSGTWSLLGMESQSPIINDNTYELNYTNEGGVGGTFRILKNIMGLWIYQECKRAWDKSGEAVSFDELDALAEEARPFSCFIDPDDDTFYSPGRMPAKVMEFCSNTGQKVPEGKGEIVRCIMESLALKYRMALEGLEDIKGQSLPVIHIVGGGCKNKILCQYTANAANRVVHAGPVEATAIGNLLCQLIAKGEVSGLNEARALVRRSFPTEEYTPESVGEWDKAYENFRKIAGK